MYLLIGLCILKVNNENPLKPYTKWQKNDPYSNLHLFLHPGIQKAEILCSGDRLPVTGCR